MATSTTEIYTLSLHDALPIWVRAERVHVVGRDHPRRDVEPREHRRIVECPAAGEDLERAAAEGDRKSTRLNSSHLGISYAVFCLKKKKTRRRYSHVDEDNRQG